MRRLDSIDIKVDARSEKKLVVGNKKFKIAKNIRGETVAGLIEIYTTSTETEQTSRCY